MDAFSFVMFAYRTVEISCLVTFAVCAIIYTARNRKG